MCILCYILLSHYNLSSIFICLHVQNFHFEDYIIFFPADIEPTYFCWQLLSTHWEPGTVLRVDTEKNLNVLKHGPTYLQMHTKFSADKRQRRREWLTEGRQRRAQTGDISFRF